nr:MAG TPA: hypothetical protein [Caudoviricetes sp.]
MGYFRGRALLTTIYKSPIAANPGKKSKRYRD